jgi:K(+)-stimulated pyrophosphate-energized sodium pump
MEHIAKLISDGSDTFLKTEYVYISIFAALFAILISVSVEKEPWTFYTSGAFLLGALTSICSGYIGMWIAVRANVRVTK